MKKWKKITVVVDSFKGSLSSLAANAAVKKGIKAVAPNCQVTTFPVSDGGEGWLDLFKNTTQEYLEIVKVPTKDPLMRPIIAEYGYIKATKTAIIEMAKASGLPLLKKEERNPWLASSYGTGLLIKAALDKGCKTILLGLGGSATNDVGIGLLQALGVRCYNQANEELAQGAKILQEIDHLDFKNRHPRLKSVELKIACDVTNPLCGENGATAVFAPQKGATQKQLAQLEKGVRNVGKILEKMASSPIISVPGSGAAGGVSASLLAICQVTFVSAMELILKQTTLLEEIRSSELVITGEGRIDTQTIMGKLPFRILTITKQENIPLVAIAGEVKDHTQLAKAGFATILPIHPPNLPIQQAMDKQVSQQHIETTIQQFLLTANKI